MNNNNSSINGYLGKGALVLSMLSTEQANSLISLVQIHGSNSKAVAKEIVADSDGLEMPQILAFLDGRGKLTNLECRSIAMAFYVDVLTMLKVPRDQDYYRDQLKAVFNLSDEYADKIADSIETVDVVEGIGTRVAEWLKRVANKVGFDFENTQEFDTDALYERYLYGQAIIEMYRRIRMMGAGAIALFQTVPSANAEMGDPEAQVGEAYSAATSGRALPYKQEETGFLMAPLMMAATSSKMRGAALKAGGTLIKKISLRRRKRRR